MAAERPRLRPEEAERTALLALALSLIWPGVALLLLSALLFARSALTLVGPFALPLIGIAVLAAAAAIGVGRRVRRTDVEAHPVALTAQVLGWISIGLSLTGSALVVTFIYIGMRDWTF